MLLKVCLRRSSAEPDSIQSWNLISGVSWHGDWKPTQEAVSGLWLYNRNPRGLALYGWTVAARFARPLCRKLNNRRHGMPPEPEQPPVDAGASGAA